MAEEKRLYILSENEINEIFAFPKFTSKDRDFYIPLGEEEMGIAEEYKTAKTKVYFILLASYFKATGILHEFNLDNVRRDTNFVLKKYFKGKKLKFSGTIWRNIKFEQRKKIVELYKYKLWDDDAAAFFHSKLLALLKIHANHIDAFKEALELLRNGKFVLPSYRILQDCLTKAMTEDKERIKGILDKNLTATFKSQLKNMLNTDDALLNLSTLKVEAKNFNKGELSKEVQKCEEYRELYTFAKEVVPKLDISGHAVKQYGELVEQISIFRLRQMKPFLARFYLICYIHCKFQKISDNLVTGFVYHITKFNKERKTYSDEKLLNYNREHIESLPEVSKLLKLMVNDYPDDLSYKDFLGNVAYSLIPKEKFTEVADFIAGNGFDKEYFKWEYCSVKSSVYKLNIRPLFLNINFGFSSEFNELEKAVDFLKLNIRNQASLNQLPMEDFPDEFIPGHLEKYIKESVKNEDDSISEKYNVDKYEFLIYQQLFNHLDHENIYCHDTYLNRSLQEDLLPEKTWKDKEEILKTIEYKNITCNISERLIKLEETLDSKIFEVNDRIASGENKEFKLKVNKKSSKETWHLEYSKQKEENKNTLFQMLPKNNIADILYFLNDRYCFLKAFRHIKPKYSKMKVNIDALIAAITANAFSSGINQMAEMSNIRYSTLKNIEDNYLRYETLKPANDLIVGETRKLPIFNEWNISPDKLFGSVDGQKFETKLQNLQARYSKKYFGLNKGVVENSLNVNHLSVNSDIIGANEREDAYVFDLVYNNTSDIDPEYVTGDMHTINKLNHAFLDAINKTFIPNYVNIQNKLGNLCCFGNTKNYKDLKVKPKHKVNKKLIIEQWEYIQHILASLILQDSTQSVIVKKLNSSKGKSKLKQALWEYNNIFMSIHMLDYINDPVMRSNIRTTLNRIEEYHQLRRSIANVHGGKFRGRSTFEVKVWNQCARLVSNCILLYNAIILTDLFEKCKDDIEKENAARISPIVWSHINMKGNYDFRKRVQKFDVSEIVEILKKELFDEK